MTEQEMMEIWTKMATPGPEHALLAKMSGDWTATIKSWMDPAQPPSEGKGSSKFSMVLGGRVRQEEFHCDMSGMVLDGLGLLGFDNYTKKFWLTWCDSMSTSLMTSEGMASADGKSISVTGKVNQATTGKNDVPVKCVYRLIDDNHWIFETYDQAGTPQEKKTLEVDYRRK